MQEYILLQSNSIVGKWEGNNLETTNAPKSGWLASFGTINWSDCIWFAPSFLCLDRYCTLNPQLQRRLACSTKYSLFSVNMCQVKDTNACVDRPGGGEVKEWVFPRDDGWKVAFGDGHLHAVITSGLKKKRRKKITLESHLTIHFKGTFQVQSNWIKSTSKHSKTADLIPLYPKRTDVQQTGLVRPWPLPSSSPAS